MTICWKCQISVENVWESEAGYVGTNRLELPGWLMSTCLRWWSLSSRFLGGGEEGQEGIFGVRTQWGTRRFFVKCLQSLIASLSCRNTMLLRQRWRNLASHRNNNGTGILFRCWLSCGVILPGLSNCALTIWWECCCWWIRKLLNLMERDRFLVRSWDDL